MERPEYCTDDHLKFMDTIREIGAINPLAAGPELMDEFGLTHREAKEVVHYWMNSFNERHPS